jgi:hypothetical protein
MRPGSSEHVRVIVRAILSEPDRTRAEHEVAYPVFAKKYPTLFEMACAGRLDDAKFELLMQQLERVQSGQASQYDASATVGQALFDEYVKPRVAVVEK